MKALLFALVLLPFAIWRGEVQAAQLLTGDSNAKVQMLVYGDYECPFTVLMMKHIDPLAKEFGDDLAVSFAQFPLDFHPNALDAARAAVCAGDQGMLKAYSDSLFENSRNLSPLSYRSIAKLVGLPDLEAFEACRTSALTAERVAADTRSGRAIGVNGTPNIFINGQLIQGAYPIDEFQKVIREKIAGLMPAQP